MTEDLNSESRLKERFNFYFPVRISHSINGETVSLSESGLSLALEEPLNTTRSVLVELFLPFSFPILSTHGEIIWKESQKKEERFYCGVRFLKLGKEERSILNEVFERFQELNKDFASITKDFRIYLSLLKKELDNFDSITPSEITKINNLDIKRREIFCSFDAHFERIWDIAKNFNKTEYQVHKKYYQGMLGHLLVDLIEINRFVHKKPLGYSGDFMLINYHYDFSNTYLGKSSFERLINFYTTNIGIAKSVVERKDFFKNKIKNLIRNKPNVNILSVGSGAARELLELVEENEITNKVNFDGLDFEKEAVLFVTKKFNNIDDSKRLNLNLNLIQSDLLDLLRDTRIEKYLKKYDLIYSAGLFDYLNDRVATKIINNLFKHLNIEGEFIITNVDADSMNKIIYYEMLGEWELIHRKKEEMYAWVKDIQGVSNCRFIDLTPKNSFLFLSITKTN